MSASETAEPWHSGPPPAMGWFPASNARSPGVYRWWDGEAWSFPAFAEYKAEDVGRVASRRMLPDLQARTLWQHQPRYWPENAQTYERP